MMRKLFLTMFFLTLTQWIVAQCYDINGFTVTSTTSVCPANGQIAVTLPAASAGCTASLTVELKLPTGATGGMRSNLGLGQTINFNDLAPGVYSVILHDPSGTSSTAKTIEVKGTYKNLDVRLGQLCGATMSRTSTTSTAFSEENGTIEFTIMGGTGVGTNFEISLEDEHGNILVPARNVSRPNAATNFTYTLTKMSPTDRIPSGIKVFLVVKNVIPSGLSTCGEDIERVDVIMPPAIYMPGSYNIAWGNMGLRTEDGCKYSLGINIRRDDGQTVHYNGGCRVTDILTHFRATGRATITVINSSDASRIGAVDNIDYYVANPLRGFNGWGYRTYANYLSGDELLITVDDGFGTVLKRQFVLNVTPNRGFALTNSSSEATACDPYLRIKTTFGNSNTLTFPNSLVPGDNISVTPYQWQNIYTRANWLAGKFRYEVKKLVSGTYTSVAHTEIDFDQIDVTAHGTGTYQVSVISDAGCPVNEERVVVSYAASSRFQKAFNSIEKNYGIYEGTASFRMPMPTDFYYKDATGTNKGKITITRADGQTSVSVPNTSLFFETPTTKTINFPIEMPLVPGSVNSLYGIDYVGLGDFPPGEYVFKLEDACGEATSTITFTQGMSFGSGTNRPSYDVIKKCDTNEITYTLGTVAPNRAQIHVYLQRKNAAGSFDTVDIRNFSPNGTFSNLTAGTYRLQTLNYYYTTTTTPTGIRESMWTLLPPFANLPLTGLKTPDNPYILEEARGYSPEIVINPHSFVPYVSGLSCGSTNGSGMVLIDLSLSDLANEDITYELYEEIAGGTRSLVTSVTVSPTVTTYSFQNLNNGTYSVDIKNTCFTHTTQIVEVNSDDIFRLPAIVASQNICPGTKATMELDVSPTLFDIQWFRIDPVSGVSTLVGTGQTHSETVHTSTTFEVNVALKSSFGCASGNTTTQTVTIAMVNDTTPPTVTSFPADQTLTIPTGQCFVTATWTVPTATDNACTVTITSTHTSPLNLNEGVHTVTYTFTDDSGNSVSRNLVFTVTPTVLNASLTDRYTDGTNALTELTTDQLFYYEVSFANVATETISTATLTVQLPSNTNVAPSTTPDLSGAGTGASSSYNSVNKTYTITIPNFPTTGGIVKIPLQLLGGQALAAQPCMNVLNFTSTMLYQGGGTTCLRTQTATTSSTIEINTSTYSRSVVDCSGVALTAENGFTGYQWYEGTNLIVGATGNVYTPTISGQYRVEKTILCGTRNVTSFETFTYTSSVEITRINVVRSKVNCAHLGQLTAESANGVAPYRYMARIHTATFPTLTDFTTPSATDVVTTFGNNVLDLPLGTYKVYVLDSNNCIKEYTASVFTITQAVEPTITNVTVDICNSVGGVNNAEVNITFGETSSNHFYTLNGGSPQPVTASPFTISNLSAGTHTLTVTDADGCGATHTFTVDAPITIGTATLTQVLTCATPTAQISLPSITGGTGTYSYELVQVIDRTTGQYVSVASSTVTSLPINIIVSNTGEYEFRVWDSNTLTCPKISTPVVVNAAELPRIDTTRTQITPAFCFGQPEGSIEVWALPTNLAPFQFNITQVRDLSTGTVSTVTITPTSTSTDSAKFTGLIGTLTGMEYTIEVIGNNGCLSRMTAIVTSGLPIVANDALSVTQFTCATGSPTAVISFDVSQVTGGTSSYTWEFFNKTTGISVGGNNQASISVTDLNGGTFYAVVTDISGSCSTNTNEVTIMPAFALSNVVASTVSQVTCISNERISVSVATTPNYIAGTTLTFRARRLSDNFTITETYSSTTAIASVTHTFTSLLPTGDYEITVINANTQCQAQGTHQVIDLSDKIEIVISDEKQPSCYQGSNGEATLTFIDKKPTVGGNVATSGFTYTVTHLTTNQVSTGIVPTGTQTITLSNFTEGNYRIDAISTVNRCSVSALFTIPQSPSQIVVSATASPTAQVNCVTGHGSIAVAITSGGKAPYVVTLTSASGVATQSLPNNDFALFNGLSVGVYTITVVDDLGCSSFIGTQSVELKASPAVVASITTSNISCHGENDGRILITNVSGGSGTNIFTYELISATDPRPEQSSNVFENLKAGSYTIIIKDGMSCSTSTSTTIIEPGLITARIDLTGSDRIVCYGQANGYVKVKAQGGTQPYAIDIYDAETHRRVTPVSVMSPAPANPSLAPEVEVLTNAMLEPGTFYARVMDARGCAVTTTSFTVEEFPNIEPREVYQESDCRSNTLYDPIVVRFANEVDAANTYYYLGGSGRSSFTRVEGNYGYIDNYDRTIATQTLTIEYTKSHSDGQQLDSCQSSVWTIQIQNIQALTASEVTNNSLNTIQVQASGGVAPYRYAFNNRDQGDDPVYVVKINDPGYYDPTTGQTIKEIPVEVTDSLGCTYTLTIQKVYYDIEVPNFFTPDGDGNNDTWTPKNLQNYSKSRVYIYDRHGRLIITLTSNDSWGGIYDGKHMPSGDYWYVLELNDRNDTRRFYGNFTLYR